MQLDVGREVHGREKYQGGEEGCGNRVFLRKKKKRYVNSIVCEMIGNVMEKNEMGEEYRGCRETE